MICYFDSDTEVNLSHLEQIRNVRSLNEIKKRFANTGLISVTSRDYSSCGIYFIEVSKHSNRWCGKTFSGSDNVLLNISSTVIRAAQEKKIRIVIQSIIEGDNFLENIDSFWQLQTTVKLLSLPPMSVVIISGNLNAASQYSRWCIKNQQEEIIKFLEGIEWDGKESNQIETPIHINSNALAYNSLNRAHRNHRSDHLYYLAANNMLENSLVSGGHWFSEESILRSNYYSNDDYETILRSNYPRSIDVTNLKDQTPNLVNNIFVYENTMLTVVTESHYDQNEGLFITEKTFRPILLGHPFIALSQPGLIKKLKEYGFDVEYLDSSYDDIEDNQLRFFTFHEVLNSWYNLKNNSRKKIIQQWQNQLLDNFLVYKKTNFKQLMYTKLIEDTEKYFKEYS